MQSFDLTWIKHKPALFIAIAENSEQFTKRSLEKENDLLTEPLWGKSYAQARNEAYKISTRIVEETKPQGGSEDYSSNKAASENCDRDDFRLENDLKRSEREFSFSKNDDVLVFSPRRSKSPLPLNREKSASLLTPAVEPKVVIPPSEEPIELIEDCRTELENFKLTS